MTKKQWRDQIEVRDREKRDKDIVEDYHKQTDDGGWLYTVKELALKYKLSITGIYKILKKHHVRRD